MSTTASRIPVTLTSPGSGPYRLQLLGNDPSRNITHVDVGDPAEWRFELAPGSYTAFYESLGGGGRESQTIEIRDSGPVATRVELGPVAPERPTRIASTSSASARVDDGPRRFSIGISTDSKPKERGGWTAKKLDVKRRLDVETGALCLEINRLTGWKRDPKRRLTIAIDGRAAWRIPLPLFQCGLDVWIYPSVSRRDGGQDLDVQIVPKEANSRAIVATLEPLDRDETERLVTWSVGASLKQIVGALVQKQNDPWAATLAGLALIREPVLRHDISWARNLTNWFPWLPDGPIVAAAAVALQPGLRGDVEAEAAALLALARRRGPPYFKVTNDLALSLLTTLAISAENRSVRTAATKTRADWTERARRALDSGFVMSWEVKGPGLRKGVLPRARYEIVATGRLTGGSVELDKPKSKATVTR